MRKPKVVTNRDYRRLHATIGGVVEDFLGIPEGSPLATVNHTIDTVTLFETGVLIFSAIAFNHFLNK